MMANDNDIYSQLGISPNDYAYDPVNDIIVLKEQALPSSFDERFQTPANTPIPGVTGVPIPVDVQARADAFEQSKLPWTQQKLPVESSGYKPLDKLMGLGGEERYQLWPEKMIRSGLTLAGDVASGKLPVETESTGEKVTIEPYGIWQALGAKPYLADKVPEAIVRAQDMAGLAGMSTIPGVARAGGIAKDTLGVVPVARAKEMKVQPSQPSEILRSAVENTPDASLDANGALRINLKRKQLEDQEMAESVRSGVFYLPASDPRGKHYTGKNNYGGNQVIEGETAYLNPLVVKGATGGKAPEAAYIQLKGKDAFKKLNDDVMQVVTANGWMRKKDPAAFDDLINRFLETHAPELTNHAQYILENSKQGNQLLYALQEAAIAHAARDAGHDGVIGYSVGRGANSGKPFISEIFDVRENRYPSPSGDYSVHPMFLQDTKAATGIAGLNSSLQNTIANAKVGKATPEQWQQYLKNQPGVKPEELEFSLQGLPQGVITKEQLLAHARDNGVKLQEVWKGDTGKNNVKEFYDKQRKDNEPTWDQLTQRERQHWVNEADAALPRTKYSSYQLPGGENYRELLLTVPEIPPNRISFEDWFKNKHPKGNINEIKQLPEGILQSIKREYENDMFNVNKGNNYKSSHWDEPNPLVHIRMNDRNIPGVGKTLHIEEIQSDWHQAGRKQGYKGQNITAEDIAIRDRIKNNTATEADYKAWDTIVGDKFAKDTDSNLVPNAPFKKTWDELALKKVLTQAVNDGYDAVSWTPGEAQAARYDLSKQVKNIQWDSPFADKPDQHQRTVVRITPNEGKTLNLQIDKDGKVRETFPRSQGNQFEGKILSDIVGKEHADKIMSKSEGNLEGEGLKIGGEGMKGFYDTMLPAKANALIKKMGGKVEYENIPSSSGILPEGGRIHANRYHLLSEEQKQSLKRDPDIKIPIIKITPQMRETIAQKGFPLYSAGVPVFTPVSEDPFKKKEPKLVPVDFNPFAVAP